MRDAPLPPPSVAGSIAVPGVAVRLPRHEASYWRDAVRRLSRNKLAVAGAVLVAAIMLIAAGADVLEPYPYAKANFSHTYESPGPGHPLGTDPLGRDLLSRMIYGARISMIVGVGSQVLVVLIGVPIGALAGYHGGRLDAYLMRAGD